MAESVFCPTFTNASPLLLDAIDFRESELVLDAFAGSGAFAINAALRGNAAVSIELDSAAHASGVRNARLNRVDDVVDARCGAVSRSIHYEESFDLIIANPPLLPFHGTGPLAKAMFDPGLSATMDFLAIIRRHLAVEGRGYLLTSDVLDRCGYDFDRLCFENNLVTDTVVEAHFGYETYRVHRITRRWPQ
jgi:SAM-dependent methyltransferase